METSSQLLLSRGPLVVGSAGNQRALNDQYSTDDCDVLELRLDSLGNSNAVYEFIERHRESLPLLLTARHPDEGGLNALSGSQRAKMLSEFFPAGTLLDLELQSIGELQAVWESARDAGMLRVASWHDFDRCPTRSHLKEIMESMAESGADIAKCAFALKEPSDLLRIAEAAEDAPLPLAIMGMGPLAPASRLLAAQLGSILNYGYLGEDATAPGQWRAQLLREGILSSS